MKLHVQEWGTGDRVAALIHGITSDSGGWWRLGPELASRGYHVLAPDLRGHGLSPRGEYSPQALTEDVVESLPAMPELALGHSLGGVVLALAIERLRPARAIYEDPAWLVPPGRQPQAAAEFAAQKGWDRQRVAAANPRWPAHDVDAKLAALRMWDPATAATLLDGRPWDYVPEHPLTPSLVLLADPSELVPLETSRCLTQQGFEVRVVQGAGHSIHRDDYDALIASLDDWL